jgi:hypothetical protein
LTQRVDVKFIAFGRRAKEHCSGEGDESEFIRDLELSEDGVGGDIVDEEGGAR